MVVKLRWPWWCSGAATSCRENEAVSNGGPKCGGATAGVALLRCEVRRGGVAEARTKRCDAGADARWPSALFREGRDARGAEMEVEVSGEDSGCGFVVALCGEDDREWHRWMVRGGGGGDASLQNRGGRKRRWLPWRLMVAARVWGKLGFLFWEMKMMTWQNLIG